MAVPQAKITLINEDTNQESHIISNKKGYYRILLTTPGRYKFSVEADGFMTYGNELEINNNESLQLNVSLEVIPVMGVIVTNDGKSNIDLKSSGNTVRITRETIDRLTH